MAHVKGRASVVLLVILSSASAVAQIIVPGADGSDGAFNPTSNVQVRLDLAPTATWDGPNPNPGQGFGVYDPDKWAIVFRYSSVNVPSGVTVTFFNHPANPPVVWLVSGPVTINGVLSLDPANPPDPTGFTIGGPGGFRGGASQAVGGLGPGGGALGQGAQYGSGSRSYGNTKVQPLIGGSGGGGTCLGMGGGGAMLIACNDTLAINGGVRARSLDTGQNETGGSGGAIRLICNRLLGTGTLVATSIAVGCGGGTGGGSGRIRVEANEVSFAHVGDPVASFGLPGATAAIWPDDAVAPSCHVVTLGQATIPSDPRASFAFPYADVNLTNGTAQTLVIECRNVPTGGDPPGTPAWNVVARVVPRGSAPFTANATYVSGDYAQSIWHATLNLPSGFAAIQVRAAMPPP